MSQPQREDGKSQGVVFSRYFVQKDAGFNESSNIFKLQPGPHINLLKASRKIVFVFLFPPPPNGENCSVQMLHIWKPAPIPVGFSCPASTLAKPPVLEIELERQNWDYIATTKSKNKKLESQPKFYLLDWSPVVIML